MKAARLAIMVAPAAQAFVEKVIEAAPADDVDASELVGTLRAVALAAGATLAKAAKTDDYAETLAVASNAFASRKGVLGAVAAAKKRRDERAALREAASRPRYLPKSRCRRCAGSDRLALGDDGGRAPCATPYFR